MELNLELFDLLIIIGSGFVGNLTAVKVMASQLNAITKRLDNNDVQIKELYDRTRYVMSGHQIREEIKAEVKEVHTDVKDLQHTCRDIMNQMIVYKTNSELRLIEEKAGANK